MMQIDFPSHFLGQKQLLSDLKALTNAELPQKEVQKLHDALLLESTTRCLAEANFDAINGEQPKFGCFLKDYQECEW